MNSAPVPIERFDAHLPHGITLSCRACGPKDAEPLVFLHGFPEGAFVWDELMSHFADRYRCVAPNLRGYERSSAPTEVAAYRPKALMADVDALIAQLGGTVEALVAHDWGGAVAWKFAVKHADRLRRLVIINAPHPATFLRELQRNPEQQTASSYMNFLRRPDAQALLVENDYARLWLSFTNMGASDKQHPGGGWLTEDLKTKYREVWRSGLDGPLNYYRASPLHPPTDDDRAVLSLQLAPETVTVPLPTLVIWGEADAALRPGMLDGLAVLVPQLRIVRVPDATHWIVHERPALLAREIERELSRSGA